MPHVKHAIRWFEIPVMNFERAKEFYSAILQTDIQEYFQGADRRGLLPFDADEGGIGGAIVHGPDFLSSQRGCLVYLYCSGGVAGVLDRVLAAGGRIEREASPFPEAGQYAVIVDSEGNRVALYGDE
ncbi:VOC family protein [Chitinophaga lutea]|uniref:VOC family protein n=1 Tax=Chitinophaga lutea TaxID=2488634 RepID=A0A3N4PY31_9BACT|nr:VOC family protein [Chitinophaga lutea]RPE12858.1 VOC family protein [Chitinophaga lutea]